MIFGENQVRNFYVVTKSDSSSEDRGNAVAVVNPSMKKFFVKYWGPESIVAGSGSALITSNIVDLKSIRDIRISKPNAMKLRQWEIKFDSNYNSGAPVVGENYLLYFNISNALGFGDVERWNKDIVVHAFTGDTATIFMERLYNVLATKIKTDQLFGSLFELGTFTSGSSTSVVLKEKKQPYNRIMDWYPIQANITINVNKAKNGATPSAEVYWANAATYNVHDNKGVKFGGIEPTLQTNQPTNGYVIAAMESFFLRGRADLYGYNCVVTANPSEVVADPTKDYFVLDIKYFHQGDGMNSVNSEKEMTFACDNISVLQTIAKVLSDNGVPCDENFSNMKSDSNFTYAFINSQADLDKYKFMLADYYAYEQSQGRTPGNLDTWNGDGWVVATYNTKPGAGKTVQGTYNGNSCNWNNGSGITTTENSSYVIASVTDAADGIQVSPASDFDLSKYSISIS